MGGGNYFSSPLRRGDFDLLFFLCTQESIHRLLHQFREEGEAKEVSFTWLRVFYSGRVAEFFDGDQAYGRADDFLEELVLTPPSIIDVGGGRVGLIDPMRITEDIINVRTQVAREWMQFMKYVPQDHIDLRKTLFERQILKWGQTPLQSEERVGVIEGGEYE